ncbi:MAG: alpha/beta hydrolase [Saprospiraceae bacterium]|nr:alpha/beta hydrolase [Candidatus Opimibacter iunctus]
MKPLSEGYNLTTEVNHFNLSYDDIGSGDMPIIFLHGYPFDKTMWEGQLQFLRSSYRVIALDIRGFGASRDEQSLLSIDLFADDVITFMNKLEIEKAIICGLSMGGFIALNAIARFPDRFEALILCDTQCIADTAEVKANRYKTIDEIKANGPDDFNEGFIKSVFHKDSLIQMPEIVEAVRNVVFSNSQQIIINGLIALAERSETCTTLGRIAVPTLIICGREDVVTPLPQSEYMHEHIKGSLLRIIENAGHVSNLEHQYEFNKILYDFLMSLKVAYTAMAEEGNRG